MHRGMNAVQMTQQKMQRKLTPHCRQCPSEDDSFATCGLPATSICWEAVKENSNNLLKDLREQLLHAAWKPAPTKTNFLSTASSQDHLPTYMYYWKNAGRCGQVQILRIHTNQRRAINKGSNDQTGATSSDMTRLAMLWKSKAISLPTKIKLSK